MEAKNLSRIITTPAGYQYEATDFVGKPYVSFSLTYEYIYEIILDGLQCEASLEPITAPTFWGISENFIHLLIDAYEDELSQNEDDKPLMTLLDLDAEEKPPIHVEIPFKNAHEAIMNALNTFGLIRTVNFESVAGKIADELVMVGAVD